MRCDTISDDLLRMSRLLQFWLHGWLGNAMIGECVDTTSAKKSSKSCSIHVMHEFRDATLSWDIHLSSRLSLCSRSVFYLREACPELSWRSRKSKLRLVTENEVLQLLCLQQSKLETWTCSGLRLMLDMSLGLENEWIGKWIVFCPRLPPYVSKATIFPEELSFVHVKPTNCTSRKYPELVRDWIFSTHSHNELTSERECVI